MRLNNIIPGFVLGSSRVLIPHQHIRQSVLHTISLSAAGSNSEMPKSTKYYAVKKGRKTGIFQTWDDCKSQTHKYQGSIFKSFKTMSEAQQYMNISGGVSSTRPSSYSSIVREVDVRRVADTRIATAPNVRKPVRDAKARGSLNGAEHNSSSSELNNANMMILLKIEMYFDGGSRGNPGLGGSGAHVITTFAKNDDNSNNISDNNEEEKGHQSIKRIRHYCGRCTNNIAEYTGLTEGLKHIKNTIDKFCTENQESIRKGLIQVKIFGDSNLIVKQMNGTNAVKNPGLKVKYQECQSIIDAMKKNVNTVFDKEIELSISFQHVYRENNTDADILANEAMDEKRSWCTEEDEV
jgi:ribonuclease HI